MLRLIERMLPAPLHRLALRIIFPLRHQWRRWRKVPIVGCNIILTDFQGDLLLLKHSYGPQDWLLPGGGVDRGEHPADAASRELKEELGLETKKLTPIGELEGEISGSPHTMYLFAAVIDKQPRPDNREVTEARFFPTQSLPQPLGVSTRRALSHWKEGRGPT